jgi:hypothetical protein
MKRQEIEMTAKNVLYAAVGAPVVAARKVAEAVTELRSTLNKEADSLGKTANKRVAVWANEGEKVVNRITDAKMVDDLTSKVDFDQVSTQVSKLRDQLEDMLNTWRASFRPEKVTTAKVEGAAAAVKAPVTKASAKVKKATAKSATETTGTKKAASQKAGTHKSAAKKAPAKVHAKKAATKSSGPVKATKASAAKSSTKKVSAKAAS